MENEIYADGFKFKSSGYTFDIQIVDRHDEGQPDNIPKAVWRMPMQVAKELAISLNKSLHQYENQMGTSVPVNPQFLARLGIAPEDFSW